MTSIARAIASIGLAGCALVAHASTVSVLTQDFTDPGSLSQTYYNRVATGTRTGPGDAAVVSDPSSDFTNGYNHAYDHTSGNEGGRMLFFDGSPTHAAIWSATVPLMADVLYTFSFWMMAATTTGESSNPPLLSFSLGHDQFTTTQVGEWQQFVTTFQVAAATDVALSIFDDNPAPYALGNDGAIDDISLTFVKSDSGNAVPEPSEAVLMAGGFGVLAWMLRKRRRDSPSVG